MPLGILNKTLIINGVSVTTEELRNSLLDRNLPPPIPNEVQEGNYQTFYEDIGQLFSLPNPLIPETVQIDEDALQDNGEDRRTINLSQNKYQDSDGIVPYQVVDLIINPNIVVNGNYTYQNFGLIEGSGEIGIQNPFTSIDADRNTNFDTRLANIASERLQLAINERISQAIINETVDRVNLDPLSLIQGNELIQSNYDITTPSTIIGKGVELIGKITGAQLPVSTIPKGVIGWQEYNQAKANSGKLADGIRNILKALGVSTELNLTTEKRTDELLKRTGSGQKNALFRHLSLNRYVPNYSSPRLFGLLGDRAPNSRYYIGSENSTNRGYGVTKRFKEEDFLDGGGTGLVTPTENFVWGIDSSENASSNVDFAEQTLLSKTKYLTDQFSETDVYIDQTKKFFKDKITDKQVSRGNAIQNNSGEYARVWLKSTDGTEREQLEKGYSYQNAIRKSGLFIKDSEKPGFSVDSGKASLSVLQSNGIVKSYPYLEESFTTYKKYMLSLENLAWSDNIADLPIQEIGPGDLVSGRKGRIMWFAPYDLSFDETTTANWTETEFLGRAEPIYTYNNTRRSGTLKFKLLVDHPRVVNEYRGRQNNELEKFFAGITSPQELLDLIQKENSLDLNTKTELEKKLNSIVRQTKNSEGTKTKEFNVYFENNISALPPTTYETELNATYIDIENNGKDSEIGKFLEENGSYTVEIKGFASKRGDEDYNLDLSKNRALSVEKLILGFNSKAKTQIIPKGEELAASAENSPINSEIAIKDRRVDVVIRYKPENDEDSQQQSLNALLNQEINNEAISNLFINETTYFDIIAEDYPNYFDNISSKLTYFHPGFHSNTPEGLNTRLNFLQQCMRQGASVYNSNDNIQPDNLAFGRPPICILRIGDFIHTKVVIKSLSINYGAGGGSPQWDLNPEGIGVQPMMADVSMSIEIIGGQSLQGPINRLQNAMSYNFYANTEMYDPRADSIRLNNGAGEIVDGVRLSEIRGEDASKQLTESLKNEIPIDQEATRLKAEANEQEEIKKLGDIRINNGEDSTFDPITIVSSLNENEELTSPSELVDNSGENKLKIVIINLNDNSEIFNGFQRKSSWEIPLSVIGKETYNNTSEIDFLYSDIEDLETELESETNNRKKKKLQKEITKKEQELETLIEESIIKFKISASFSRGKEINPKTKSYTYKYDGVAWELQ
jgi:outer membrane protein OmpA-like peptidoglycan-associated protein